jgi:hypothetical protein
MREAGAAGGAGDGRWRRIEEKREKRGEERGEMRLTCETSHMAGTSAKPPCKTAGGPTMDGFKSLMAKDFWFCGSVSKTKLRL